jgi:tetratricopeptide (TPR) repeat protein
MRAFCAYAILLGLFLAGPQALAQQAAGNTPPTSQDALAARQTQLLEVMLRQPDNLDLAFEYATISSLLGDYEAAIATFERMLIYAPGLPRVQLELGVLYFRLGSYDTARYYFESALEGPNVPPEVETRIQSYIAAIDTEEDPTEFRAAIMLGVRGQTNANAAPGGRRVTLNGRDFLLDETSTGQADVNVFAAANLHGAYDLGSQGDTLEADLLIYAARYHEVVRLDTGIAELTFGPSFNMKRFEMDNTRAGIYGILSGVRLNHANYLGSVGAGARFVSLLNPKTRVVGKAEFRRRWYNDTAAFSTVSERNGYVLRTDIKVSRQITAAWRARVFVLADFEEAKTVYNQSWEAGLGFGGTYKFASPIEKLTQPWSFDMEAGYVYREYEGPDPVISTTESQFNHEGWARAVLSVPFRPDVAMSLTGELRRQYSNYATSSYTNASAILSLMKTF